MCSKPPDMSNPGVFFFETWVAFANRTIIFLGAIQKVPSRIRHAIETV